MSKKYFHNQILFALSSLFFILGCSSEDDGLLIDSDPFYRNAKTNVDIALLFKYWSIYEVNFKSKTAEVPHSYANCDRDFFTFLDNGSYQEFVIPDSGCIPNQQNLTWSYDDGIITLRNSFGDFNEMVIVELTQQQFIFKVKLDFDEDGEEDILQLLARPYSPDERKFYHNTIQFDEPLTNQIILNWSEYEGINSFSHYEILLSTDNCNINNATVLASFNDKGITSFEDINPPQAEQLCYFLKVYTSDGLLFQSNAASISTEFIDVPGVELSVPEVSGSSITLNWEKYEGLYFSHYELVVKNYVDGYAQLYQEEVVVEINDINQTTFTHNELPLVKNPVYEIRVYNAFGKQNFYNPQEVTTAQEAIFKPEKVIDIIDIQKFVSDSEESIIYFFGSIESVYQKRLMRFNYENSSIEAISDIELNFGIKEMKLISSNGSKELLFLGNNRLLVFDAQNLEYKYDLEHNDIRAIDDFQYLGNDIFALINDEYIYTIERDFANANLIDTHHHFPDAQYSNNYLHHILKISNNRILIGSANETESIAFSYDLEGNLSNMETLNVPITSTYTEETVFNETNNSIINFRENRVYNLDDFSIESFEQPYFPKALISQGNKIIGSNNNPDWYIDDESLHDKSARILNISTNNLEIMETEGYPHFYFENSSGDIFMLSTYFKRNNPSISYDRSDFFIERIN